MIMEEMDAWGTSRVSQGYTWLCAGQSRSPKGQWERATGMRQSPDLAVCGQLKATFGGLKISLLRPRLSCLLSEGS